MKTFKRIDIKYLVPLRKKGGNFKRGMSLEAWIAITSLALTPSLAVADETNSAAISPLDLSRMTLEELSNIQISTVSKRSEPLDKAPAAIFVITREDIRRSVATSIPEILRLAPNLQVARIDSSQYAISARSFNSITANKLRSLEPNGSTTVFANMMEGHTHGFETWTSYQVNTAWKLKAGYNYLKKICASSKEAPT